MPADATRPNKTFALAKTALLVLFAVTFSVDPRPPMFAPGVPGPIGLGLCVVGLVLMLSAFPSLGGAIQIAPEPRLGPALLDSRG
jgi:protein-S-isoprenylcysteine O-methyltransferase Ste14